MRAENDDQSTNLKLMMLELLALSDSEAHMQQLIALPLTVSCFIKIQIGFTFLVPAYPGNPGQNPESVKQLCVTLRHN